MERVLVIGCSGAGKSVFARRFSERTGLPLIHLDQEFWQPGWMPTAPEAWRRRVAALAAEPRWIMDGQFGGSIGLRLKHADTVFFLDMPRWLCLMRVFRRTVRHFGRTRPDMTPGCPEHIDREFLKYIWNFEREHRPRLHASLVGFPGRVIVLQRPSAAKAFLASLAPLGAPSPAS
jgi:adenylate kinase family enzyme